MFGRHFELKLVKTNKKPNNETPQEPTRPDYAAIAEEAAKKVVVGVIVVMAAHFVLATASQALTNALNNQNN